MRYRRVFIPGASYFFTLVTHERSDGTISPERKRVLLGIARDWCAKGERYQRARV